MKNTGIIRKLDELGRIVIPKEIRDQLNLKERDPMQLYVDNKGNIILNKHLTSKCTKCEMSIDEEDKYCRNCGEKI